MQFALMQDKNGNAGWTLVDKMSAPRADLTLKKTCRSIPIRLL
jgi:hypothetical protein